MVESGEVFSKCHMCWHQCAVRLVVVDGLIKRVEGGLPGGCERLDAAVEFHYSSKRLNHPLRRVRKRGEGRWERVSWGEALDEIAERLLEIREEYGSEAVAKIGGTIHGPGDWACWRFFNYWGSPNAFNMGKNCGQANMIVECAMYGNDTYSGTLRPNASKCIVLWGTNPAESAPGKWASIRASQRDGAKIVVVDPRFSESASYADLWLQPYPATDGALGWGVIRVLVEEELYDREFVANWCTGFESVAEKALTYSLEEVSRITGVTEEKIRAFAHLCADGPTHFGWNLSGGHHGADTGYATAYTQCVIKAITGNVDRKGGNPLTGPLPDEIDWERVMNWDALIDHLDKSGRDSLTAERFPVCSKASYKRFTSPIKRAWGKGYGLPLYFLWPSSRGISDAILEERPYPVKALFIQGGNPLLTLGGAKRFYEAMKQVDLLVGMDFFMTPSMALCDYVFPAASWIERPHVSMFWGVAPTASAHAQAMPALYERKDDYYLWAQLARRVGLDGEWPETLAGMYDLLLRPSGVTMSDLGPADMVAWSTSTDREYERYRTNGHGFGTPSGKCELAPSNLAAAGLDPVPDFIAPVLSRLRSPKHADEYPLFLITGARVRPYWHSSYRELSNLRWRHELPELQVHPETARECGVVNGQTAWIETPLGRIRERIVVTPGVKPGVVHAEAFWYYPEQPVEEPYLCGVWDSNINAIIPDDYKYQDFAGDLPFRAVRCRMYGAEESLGWDRPHNRSIDY